MNHVILWPIGDVIWLILLAVGLGLFAILFILDRLQNLWRKLIGKRKDTDVAQSKEGK